MRPNFIRFFGWYLVLAVVIAACSASGLFGGAHFTDLRTVQDTAWVLQAYGPENALTLALPDSRITIIFDFNAKSASGSAGCNHYSASFSLKGPKLAFSEAMQTLMACSPDEIMEQETTYVTLLGQVSRYKLDTENLHLFTDEGDILVFSAAS